MPRPPKPSSIQLIIRAKPEWEVEFRAFKELCARNGIEYSKEIYERAIRPFLRDHNWPPGNSQTSLEMFTGELRPVLCGCGKPAEYQVRVVQVGKRPNLTFMKCKDCLRALRRTRTVFGYRLLKDDEKVSE